jgi:hypothetical protein
VAPFGGCCGSFLEVSGRLLAHFRIAMSPFMMVRKSRGSGTFLGWTNFGVVLVCFGG